MLRKEMIDMSRQIVFQAWMFRLSEIPVEEIARQGFTAIQTSPLQPIKETIYENLSNAWAIYQPIGYTIGNDLGTEEDLRNLSERCHRNGLKLIIDVVFRHLANERGNDVYHTIPYEYRHYYPESFINITNWEDEWELTHKSLSGLPALDLTNEHLQKVQFNYLKKLKELGADGFRFDAYKHITKEYRIKLAEEVKKLGMMEYTYGEMIFSRIEMQERYNEMPLYVNQGLHSSEQYAAVISHDSFDNSDNPFLRRDPNYLYAEYGYLVDNPVRCNILYYCRPDDNLWRSENIRNINARR